MAPTIFASNIGHQTMVPFDTGGSSYSLIHLLRKAVGGSPLDDALIIGAGSGNDINHALRNAVRHIDAVEIDPVIQSIGIRENPDRPYSDPRVSRHLDDGRHYLRTTDLNTTLSSMRSSTLWFSTADTPISALRATCLPRP